MPSRNQNLETDEANQQPNTKTAAAQAINRRSMKRPGVETDSALSVQDASAFAVTIRKPIDDVYWFFRNFENFPLFMKDIAQVTETSPRRSHWVVETKPGLRAEWDAEIISEQTNQIISWRSVEGSEVQSHGTVTFRSVNGRGTMVSLKMDFHVPGGKLTELITLLTGDHPDLLAQTNLRRLKALLETGVIPTIEGQSSGRASDQAKVEPLRNINKQPETRH